jgi:hypothetical protein
MRRSGLTTGLLLILVAAVQGCGPFQTCAWPILANRETMNVAFPDSASTYWSYRYHLKAGREIEIAGTSIAGRYFSLNTYDYWGRNLDGIHDTALGAGPEATAPTRARWRVVLKGGAAPGEHANVLAGTAAAAEAGYGILIYRVYVPDDPADPQAGADLPTLTIRDGDEVDRLRQCPAPAGSRLVEWFIRLFGPAATEPVLARPAFTRPLSAEGFFPNRDNKYLAALVDWKPGRVVVVEGRLPRVPADMRYWSICTNEYRKPYPTTACLHDADMTRNDAGDYKVLISTPEDRPVRHGDGRPFQWLPWGSTDETLIVLIRNMLPSEGFPFAVQSVPPGESGEDIMGPYYPRIRVEQGGG